MNATSVSLRSLTKTYGDSVAVRSASLEIEAGTLVSLLGSSGCGKTTTLRMLAGLIEPTSGEIYFDNERVTGIRPEQRPVAMVFQKALLFPHMSVGENVGFGLRLRGVPKAEVRRRVSEMLELVNLPGMEKRRPGELSGGQEQRISLARALIVRPKVLLLDEPLSALDANLRVRMRDLIRDLQQRIGVTTIFVTHDQEEAVSLSDKIALMHEGQVEQVGQPREFYARPNSVVVAKFFGAANMFQGRVVAGVFEGPLGTLPVDSGVRSGPGYLVVRQEDIEVVEAKNDVAAPGVLPVVVERLQYLGTRTRVWARPAMSAAGVELKFDAPPAWLASVGDVLSVRIAPGRCHVVPADGEGAAAESTREREVPAQATEARR